MEQVFDNLNLRTVILQGERYLKKIWMSGLEGTQAKRKVSTQSLITWKGTEPHTQALQPLPQP